MKTGLHLSRAVAGMLMLACLCGTVSAASLGSEWKEKPYTGSPFYGVKFSDNGSVVYAGGDQLLLRYWDGSHKWGGRAGFIASMSPDSEWLAQGYGQGVILLNQTMIEQWTRNMDGQVKAVAVSKNATYIISADDKGNYNSWAANGEFNGRSTTDVVKKMAISPTANIVVATTEGGTRIFNPENMQLIWADNKSGSLDEYIIISGDGSTIITTGGNRIMSHTSAGKTNWVIYPTTNAIIDTACNYDCSVVAVGSQDGTVQAIDRYGTTRWTYKAGQWINAVGVSRSGSVIAAGGLDGTVYIFDRSGDLLTQKKMDSNIRERSLAVSPDGTKIAVADQINLYGLSLMGDQVSGITETFTVATLEPVHTRVTTQPETIVPATTIPVTTTMPPTPLPTTQKSPVSIVPVLLALAAGALVTIARK